MQHARDYSASASSRWLNCPGSVIAVRNYENRGSSAALEGTCAHQLGQIGLEKELSEKELLKYIGESLSDAPDVIIDKEMVNYVQGYIDYCRSFKGDHYVEIKVSYENVVKGGFGTSDFIAIDADNKKIVCVDLKFGKGVEVSAIDNTQAQLYALGVINEYEFIYDFDDSWTIDMHIYQPRISNFSDWEITYNELMLFADVVRERVALSQQPDAPFNPSEKACQWCAHKADCNALFKHTEKVISSQFDDLDLPDATTVDVKLVLDNKKLIESWLKAVQDNAFEKIMNGEPVDGYKVVAGRSSRKWVDEDGARKALESEHKPEELQVVKFITVAQAEKLVGKKDFVVYADDHVIKSDGAPTLVPEKDKRPSITDVTCDFDELT